MESKLLRVGLIGYGAIGQEMARLISKHFSEDILLVGALIRQTAVDRFPGPILVTTHSALLAEHPQVVVEVAGHAGLREHGAAILRAGIDLLLVSTGALADPAVMNELLEAAQIGGSQARVISGAIGALDMLTALSFGGKINRVQHTLRKPPKALLPSEESSQLTAMREVFYGNARQAVVQFPEFLNVAAAVALASKGFDQTEVRVIADPTVEQSVHEVLAEGPFGRLRFEVNYAPTGASITPHATQLVAQSIIRTLRVRQMPFVIG